MEKLPKRLSSKVHSGRMRSTGMTFRCLLCDWPVFSESLDWRHPEVSCPQVTLLCRRPGSPDRSNAVSHKNARHCSEERFYLSEWSLHSSTLNPKSDFMHETQRISASSAFQRRYSPTQKWLHRPELTYKNAQIEESSKYNMNANITMIYIFSTFAH